MRQSVLVAGASGSLGRAILRELEAHSYSPIALTRQNSRKAAHLNGISLATETRQISSFSSGELPKTMEGVSTVISCLGAPVTSKWIQLRDSYSKIDTPVNIALLKAAQEAGCKRFVYISAFGAEQARFLAYNDAHERVVDALNESSMEVVVLRPTGFFSALSEYVEFAKKGFIPLVGDGESVSNPISELDVAKESVRAIKQTPGAYELGGPEILSRREMGEKAFQLLGKKARFIKIPPFLFRFGAFSMKLISPRFGELFPFVYHVSTRNLVAPCVGTRTLSDAYQALIASNSQKERSG